MERSPFQFTIRGLMVLVAIVAVVLVIPVNWRVIPVSVLLVLVVLAMPQWLIFRGFKRVAACGFGVLGCLANVFYVIAALYPDYMLVPGLYFIWLIAVIPMIGGCGVAWATLAAGSLRPSFRAWLGAWLLVFGLTFTPLLTLCTLWPLRTAFAFARPQFDRLANLTAAGRAPKTPVWVGPFRIVETAFDAQGNVALFLDSNPGNPQGFVRIVPGTSVYVSLPIVGSDLDVRLSRRWRFQHDD